MEEKKALAQRLIELEKRIEKKRRNWFLGIWLGYTAITYCNIRIIEYIVNHYEFDYLLELIFADLFTNTAKFFIELLISAVIGLFSWYVNSLIWSNCCNSIRDTVSVYEKLVKEYNNMP